MQFSGSVCAANLAFRAISEVRYNYAHAMLKYAVLEKTSCGHCVAARLHSTTPMLCLAQKPHKMVSSRPRPDNSTRMIALHDEKNNYLKSMTYNAAKDYVHQNYSGKTIQLTKKENGQQEVIARLVSRKKSETTFSITTSIEEADLRVKVNNIRRKAVSGLKVIVLFNERPNGASPRTVADQMKVLLAEEGLQAEVKRVNDVVSLEVTSDSDSAV